MVEPEAGAYRARPNEGTALSAEPGAMASSQSSLHDDGRRAVRGPDASEISAVGGYLVAMIDFLPTSVRSPARPCPIGPDLINFFDRDGTGDG
jgi:hypothetical protein